MIEKPPKMPQHLQKPWNNRLANEIFYKFILNRQYSKPNLMRFVLFSASQTIANWMV